MKRETLRYYLDTTTGSSSSIDTVLVRFCFATQKRASNHREDVLGALGALGALRFPEACRHARASLKGWKPPCILWSSHALAVTASPNRNNAASVHIDWTLRASSSESIASSYSQRLLLLRPTPASWHSHVCTCPDG